MQPKELAITSIGAKLEHQEFIYDSCIPMHLTRLQLEGNISLEAIYPLLVSCRHQLRELILQIYVGRNREPHNDEADEEDVEDGVMHCLAGDLCRRG